MIIKDIKDKTSSIFPKYHVSFAGVFGSVARGEDGPNSDVDFLLQFGKTPSLVQFIRLENELEAILDKKVDLVVKGSEKSLIRPLIYKDLVEVYGQQSPV